VIKIKIPLTPAHHAQELLSQMNITNVPTPIYDICNNLGIVYIETGEIDAEALLIKKHDEHSSPIIAVKAYPTYQHRTKFSVAHEIGHYILPTHLGNIYACTLEDLNSYTKDKTIENEANIFAAELLLPSKWLLVRTKSEDLSMSVIKNISDECDVSLTATAIQATKVCPDKVAIIYSKDGHIKWFSKSESFTDYLNTGLLSRYSNPAKYFTSGDFTENVIKVPTSMWADTDRSDACFVEESIAMPNLNAVLTLLRYYHDNDEDGPYEEEW
jgi:Zn-dependent peptidase ImmA (M78 family)